MSEIVNWIFLTFSTREIAVIVWSLIIIVFVVAKVDFQDPRKLFTDLLQFFFKWQILFPVGLLIAYVVGEIYLLRTINMWDANSTKDTVFWFLGVAFVMLFNATKAGEKDFFRSKLKSALQAITILEFIIGNYTFNLLIELILVPIATLITLLHTVTNTDTKYEKIGKVFHWMLVIMGFVVIGFSFAAFIQSFTVGEAHEMLKNLLLPVFLTIGLLPFIYMLGLLFVYENVFHRITWSNKQVDKRLLRFARRKIFFTFGLNLFKLTRWSEGKSLRINSKDDVLKLLTT